ncbi:MAG: hypothetical protein K2G74_04030 [Muribaculaceae bacterium]|nr:hypothetical protein [Muribaculaceae bacterium]
MNNKINHFVILLACSAALTACNENSWNDKLEGFESDVKTEITTTRSYTLTDDDYTTISKELLKSAETKEDTIAARAIASNKYFDKNSVYPAPVAVPVLFSSVSNPYNMASNGSTLDVTYQEASSVPEEIAQLGDALKYTLTSADYQTVWESDDNFISGFAPSKPATSSLPSILKTALPDAESGDYAVVTYNEAATNPVFGTPAEAEPFELSSVIGSAKVGDEIKVAGIVTGLCTRGYIVTDASGSMLVYVESGFDMNAYSIGLQVNVSGAVGAYNGGLQLTIANESKAEVEEYTYPAAITLTKDNTAELGNEYDGGKTSGATAKYVTLKGVNKKSGNYNNIYIDGLEGYDISFYQAPSSVTSQLEDNAEVTVTGYLSSRSGSKAPYHLNVLVTEFNGAKVPAAAAAASVLSRAAVAEVPTEVKNAVYTLNGSKWEVAEGVVILNPADYVAMGMTNNKLNDADIYIPMYLKSQFPYALDGEMKYVMYNGNKVDLFVLAGGVWTLNNNGLETVTGRYTKKDGNWSFTKYIGKAVYTAFNEEEIILNRSYIFVSGNVCANAVDRNNSYGYLLTTQISVSGDQVVMSNDANAFTFVTTASVDGVDYTAPDGYFFIIDSNNRFVYRSGTYGSFNVSNKPSDSAGYYWTAKPAGDGKWIINCDLGDGNTRNVYFSSKYNNFAVYATATADDVFPELYILE